MKGLLVTLVMAFAAVSGLAQHAAIALTRMNVFYEGVYNPITIATENFASQNVKIQTNNGTIRDGYDSIHYSVNLAAPGFATITLTAETENGIDTIGATKYRVKPLPPPVLRLGGSSGGQMPLTQFRIQIAPSCMLYNFDIEVAYKVYRFTLLVIRDKEVIFKRMHLNYTQGCRFDNAAREFFTTMKPGDVVWITDCAAGAGHVIYYHLNDVILEMI